MVSRSYGTGGRRRLLPHRLQVLIGMGTTLAMVGAHILAGEIERRISRFSGRDSLLIM